MYPFGDKQKERETERERVYRSSHSFSLWTCTQRRNRTGKSLRTQVFETSASTSSASWALHLRMSDLVIERFALRQVQIIIEPSLILHSQNLIRVNSKS